MDVNRGAASVAVTRTAVISDIIISYSLKEPICFET